MIENTSERPAELHVLGAFDGPSTYITGMEAAGQRQRVPGVDVAEGEAEVGDEGEDVVLDDTWCTRDAVRELAPGVLEQAHRMAKSRFNEDGVYTRQVERLNSLLAEAEQSGGAS